MGWWVSGAEGQARLGDQVNYLQGVVAAVVAAFLEVAVLDGHLVGDVSEANDRFATGLGEGVEGGGFHLDGGDTLLAIEGKAVAVSRKGASVVQEEPG